MDIIALHNNFYLLHEQGHYYLDCRVSAGMVETSRSLEMTAEFIACDTMKQKIHADRIKIVPEFAHLASAELLETAQYISQRIGPIGDSGTPSEVAHERELAQRIYKTIMAYNEQS